MKKIAIDTACISEKYGIRGVGFYTQRLTKAFSKIKTKGLTIDPINFRETANTNLLNYDLLHYPYFDPFFRTLPIKKIKPTIVTIHDLIQVKYAAHFPRGIRGEIKWQLQKKSLKSVRNVLTDSLSSKKDIVRITGFSQEKIKVVYLAAGEEFKVLKRKELEEVGRKYSLPEKFILFVGDLNWNKNLTGLVEAFGRFGLDKNYQLVIVGKAFLNKDLAERISLVELIKKLNIYSRVKFLGFVPTEDLVAIYNLASLYCQPSFYEGFGLPVLEAMACGCPVVSSNTASLPEVAGEAALLVKPEVKEISQGLRKVITNPDLQKKLIKKGFQQVEKFSWEKTAKETLSVYKRVLNENNS